MLSTSKFLVLIVLLAACKPAAEKQSSSTTTSSEEEAYRPAYHFTPQTGWMNDPNGMVFYNNTWHLFYQYYPDSTVWGPMHWGHATSTDLVHWSHQPTALYPDSLGYIFSGSAVVDSNNTSGLGKDGKIPLIAIYTNHEPNGEKQGRNDFQYQSIAYSLDDGNHWTKYAGNPVLRSPGIRDFRDPKVSWYAPAKKWIMTLAVQDHISFYSSPDLKNWKHESDFGKTAGSHGGVWECPDLFALNDNGKQVWVLIVNINPGGPNGGSATQYFTGTFNGSVFSADQTNTKWLDYGTDEYAGITWSNTGNRKVFIGWMSNWQYAQVVPTKAWRSATTIPKELTIQKVDGQYLVASKPVAEMDALSGKAAVVNVEGTEVDITAKTGLNTSTGRLKIQLDKAASCTLRVTNNAGDTLLIGYDKSSNQYFIDRTKSGVVDFEPGFGKKQVAPRFVQNDSMDIDLFIDKASVELFADGGLTTMTAIFFPKQPMSNVTLTTAMPAVVSALSFTPLKSMHTP